MVKINLKEKRYCNECKNELFETKSVENKFFWNCKNTTCIEKSINTYDSFHYLDIQPQLKQLINANLDQINKYTSESREHLDLLDGSYYKAIHKANTLHLMVYSDGTPIKKSTNKQFWPVFVGLCELPRSLRESIHNKILSGIWFGKNKPTSDILFETLITELNSFNDLGIEIIRQKDHFNIAINFYGFLADSPGRSMILNMTQFNGYYGCPLCLSPGIFFSILFY